VLSAGYPLYLRDQVLISSSEANVVRADGSEFIFDSQSESTLVIDGPSEITNSSFYGTGFTAIELGPNCCSDGSPLVFSGNAIDGATVALFGTNLTVEDNHSVGAVGVAYSCSDGATLPASNTSENDGSHTDCP